MAQTRTFSFRLLAFGIPFLIIAFTFWLSKSIDWVMYPKMGLAITLDLLLTIPLVYFLLSYKAKLPKFTAISFLILGLILANIVLPKNQKQLLRLAEFALVPIEIGVFTFLLIKVRKLILQFRTQKKTKKDFLDLMTQVCKDVFGDNLYAYFITYEVAFFYYGLLQWKNQHLIDTSIFTYHKKNGVTSMYVAMLLLFMAEAATVHLLIMKYSEFWANVATFFSVYAIVQIMGHLKAIRSRPIHLLEKVIHIRHGLAGDAKIPIQNIKAIEINKRDPKNKPMLKKLAGDLQPHNIVLELKEAATLQSIYGIKKRFQTLCFYVDEQEKFVEEMKQRMGR